MFNKEKLLLNLAILLIGIGAGVFFGYTLGQKSRETLINSLTKQLSECSSNVVTIGKVKGKGTAEIVQKLNKEPYTPYVFGCKQDTAGIVKWFCDLPRRERRKIEKDLD